MSQLTTKRNKTNLFVRDCISNALFQLLQKELLDSITITDIIKKAGVSRMGFYRNYQSKEDVLMQYMQDIFVETLKDIQSHRSLNFSIHNIMVTTLENFKKYADKMYILLNQGLDHLIYDCYCRAFLSLIPRQNPTPIREYSYQLFLGELFHLEMTWLRNGMKETPEQLATIYLKILKLRSRSNPYQ